MVQDLGRKGVRRVRARPALSEEGKVVWEQIHAESDFTTLFEAEEVIKEGTDLRHLLCPYL